MVLRRPIFNACGAHPLIRPSGTFSREGKEKGTLLYAGTNLGTPRRPQALCLGTPKRETT